MPSNETAADRLRALIPTDHFGNGTVTVQIADLWLALREMERKRAAPVTATPRAEHTPTADVHVGLLEDIVAHLRNQSQALRFVADSHQAEADYIQRILDEREAQPAEARHELDAEIQRRIRQQPGLVNVQPPDKS